MADTEAGSLTKISRRENTRLLLGHAGALALVIIITAALLPLAANVIDGLYAAGVSSLLVMSLLQGILSFIVVVVSLGGPDTLTVFKRAGFISPLLAIIVPALVCFSITSLFMGWNSDDVLATYIMVSVLSVVVSYRMSSTLVKNYLMTDGTRRVVSLEKSQKLRVGRLYDIAMTVFSGARISTIIFMPVYLCIFSFMIAACAMTGNGDLYSLSYIFSAPFVAWFMAVCARVWDITRRRKKFKPELYREESKLLISPVNKESDDFVKIESVEDNETV